MRWDALLRLRFRSVTIFTFADDKHLKFKALKVSKVYWLQVRTSFLNVVEYPGWHVYERGEDKRKTIGRFRKKMQKIDNVYQSWGNKDRWDQE